MINISKFNNLWIDSNEPVRKTRGNAKKWNNDLPPIDPEVVRKILEKGATESSSVIVASPNEL